ncbi:hypothetical protein M5689_006923 [Euphorbia peplus]|nr:hypothetical protein M5689_006923 [Euphorbia peplus]
MAWDWWSDGGWKTSGNRPETGNEKLRTRGGFRGSRRQFPAEQRGFPAVPVTASGETVAVTTEAAVEAAATAAGGQGSDQTSKGSKKKGRHVSRSSYFITRTREKSSREKLYIIFLDFYYNFYNGHPFSGSLK